MKYKNFLYPFFGLILIASTIAFILAVQYAPYAFAVGAAGIIFLRIRNLNHSDNFRIRRLNKIFAFSTVLLIATTYLMFINHRAWAITLILSAIFDLIVSLRMPKED